MLIITSMVEVFALDVESKVGIKSALSKQLL